MPAVKSTSPEVRIRQLLVELHELIEVAIPSRVEPVPRPPLDDPPHLLPIPEASDRLGIGRTTLWGLIRDGQIPTVTIGRRRLIAEADLQAYVARLRSGRGA
jgi:excisionase family DNA binding protein